MNNRLHRILSRRQLLCGTLGVLAMGALPAQAKARYLGKAEMIRTADIIAIVWIEQVQSVSVKGQWTYRQSAVARVEKTVKGTLPARVTLHGSEDFICAQCRFAPGRYLVFLKRDGNLLTGANWQLSPRRVNGDRVAWFQNDTDPFAENIASLTHALDDVRQISARHEPRGGA